MSLLVISVCPGAGFCPRSEVSFSRRCHVYWNNLITISVSVESGTVPAAVPESCNLGSLCLLVWVVRLCRALQTTNGPFLILVIFTVYYYFLLYVRQTHQCLFICRQCNWCFLSVTSLLLSLEHGFKDPLLSLSVLDKKFRFSVETCCTC